MLSCNRRWRDRFCSSPWWPIRIWSDFRWFSFGCSRSSDESNFCVPVLCTYTIVMYWFAIALCNFIVYLVCSAWFCLWSSQVHGDVESVQLLLNSSADAVASDSAGEPLLCHALRNVLLGFQLRSKLKTQKVRRTKEWTLKVESKKSMFWIYGILSVSFSWPSKSVYVS